MVTNSVKNRIVSTQMINWRKLEWFQPDDVKKTTDVLMAKLKRSLKSNGFASPFFIWKRGKKMLILDGHHRERALKELLAEGTKIPDKLPACIIRIKNEEDAITTVVAFNSHYAQFDKKGFADFTAPLDFDELKLNFEPFKLGFAYEKEADEDEAPSKPKRAKSKRGDVYQLGDHRIVCGDATDMAVVKKATGTSKIDLVYTDPPYGISIVKKGKKGKMGSVSMGRQPGVDDGRGLAPAGAYPVMRRDNSIEAGLQAFELCKKIKARIILFWGGNYFSHHLPPVSCWLVWDKETGDNNFADAEIAYCTAKKSVKLFRHKWSGMMKASEKGERRVHPTQKPVALALWAFKVAFGKPKTVLDLFTGSGSTLIACEQSGARFFGVELEEACVDVIVQRWVNYTGETKIKKNGKVITWPVKK